MGRHQREAATRSDIDQETQAMPLIHASNTAGRYAGLAYGRLERAVRWLGETVREHLPADPVQRRRKLVLTGAVAVVSLMAVGGMVTLVRGFAPATEACARPCATERAAGGPTAAPRASAPGDAGEKAEKGETAAEPKTGRTLAPAVVRQKSAKPRATRSAEPSAPPQMPDPKWFRHGPYGHRHGPGGW